MFCKKNRRGEIFLLRSLREGVGRSGAGKPFKQYARHSWRKPVCPSLTCPWDGGMGGAGEANSRKQSPKGVVRESFCGTFVC